MAAIRGAVVRGVRGVRRVRRVRGGAVVRGVHGVRLVVVRGGAVVRGAGGLLRDLAVGGVPLRGHRLVCAVISDFGQCIYSLHFPDTIMQPCTHIGPAG